MRGPWFRNARLRAALLAMREWRAIGSTRVTQLGVCFWQNKADEKNEGISIEVSIATLELRPRSRQPCRVTTAARLRHRAVQTGRTKPTGKTKAYQSRC